MNRSSNPAADTRAAPAALTRPTVPELDSFDRYLLIDDSDEDATQIMTVLCERTCQPRHPSFEVQS
jgi:hypothetical protein